MRLEQRLRSFGGVPLTHGTLLSILGEYLSPNDKIVRMIVDGLLLPIKKGLYAVSPEITGIPLSLPLVANLLYRPSCVSMDYALHYYDIIPELDTAVCQQWVSLLQAIISLFFISGHPMTSVLTDILSHSIITIIHKNYG